MPPKRGIVKSGNAGNSSNSSKSTESAALKPDKPLFPPGFKYPLSLLHERCQKEGWEKPIVETAHHGERGYSFVVTLARFNKKTSERETVRLLPPQPYYRPSALEARHWGATYALYRFCNGIQLNRTLPHGPRDYWNELTVEHKSAADHLAWMYAADPFAALQEVKDRQAKAAQRKEVASNPSHNSPHVSSLTGSFKHSPEVRMASSLREEVEQAIKEGFSLYGSEATSTLDEETISQVTGQLKRLGFKETQVKKAASFLSEPSPLLENLLQSSSSIDAATEYLLISIPECDLPPRFLPSVNSSNALVSSLYSGTSDVKKRWVEEKAFKEAGFPIHAVSEFTSEPTIIDNWPALIVKLGKKLVGIPEVEVRSNGRPFILDESEFQALGAELYSDGHYALPSLTGPITLHVLFDVARSYPRPNYCPMYIASDSVPSYIRLHILSRILSALSLLSNTEELEHTFGMTLMRLLDEEWANLEDRGPPDVNDVLRYMMPERHNRMRLLPSLPLQNPQETKMFKRSSDRHQQGLPKPASKTVPVVLAEIRRRLPAFKARDEFLHTLSKNRVVVVVGETGSGKTTQLPQYILEFEESAENESPYIIVTQPRRISAISVSSRVSDERGNDGTVGYAVRGNSKQSKSTRLLFCTTGVVLRRLSSGDQLRDVSHIVVDEVHERSLDGDFLLLSLKRLLRTHPQLKVILMSATINHEVFSRYFDGAPVLSIPGTTHPVVDWYLEDIIPAIGYVPPSVDQQADEKRSRKLENLRQYYGKLSDHALAAVHSVANSKTIDYQLIAALVVYITEKHEKAGVLIFLPGVNEIRRCVEAVNIRLGSGTADVLPLHANLPIEEQNRVFNKTAKWKIIAATNVAETSITIDDVVYVIDAGKVKETRYSSADDLTRLEETLVTRAASKQRRGRAGRTQPGVCYKLYTRQMEKVSMDEFPKPEILRVPLEQVSLSAKLMNEDEDVKKLLGQVIDPPETATVERARFNLQELGAIDSSGKLTSLGKHIAMLPLDVRLAKMLILGTIFHCMSPILNIVALLSSKPLFTNPENMLDEASRARRKFAVDNSDLLTDLEAVNQCQKLAGQMKHLKLFCKENFISVSTLQEVFTLRREFCAALQERGFVPPQCDTLDPAVNVNSENLNLLKAIILGGLWPRVARVHLPKSAIKFDKIQAGTVQRDNTAKEFKMLDLREGRVFIHPASILFECASWKSPFIVYFHKYQSSKVFLRDATEVPIYALLLFGGPVSVDHVQGGLTIGNKEAFIKLKAWPRIGVLVNQLRYVPGSSIAVSLGDQFVDMKHSSQLLELILASCIEEGSSLSETQNHPVILAMLSLLTRDGMTEHI